MDPLSLTASIIAIVQLTSTLTDYLNEVRDASKEQQSIAIEASNLYGLLIRLRYRVDSAKSTEDTWFRHVKLLGATNGPLDQLKKNLEELVEHAGINKRTRTRDRVIASLQWHWTKPQVDKSLQSIERLKSLITFALADDLYSLAEAIHDEVKIVSSRLVSLEVTTTQASLRGDISKWLAAPDPSTNYGAALQRKHPGTGTWLLKHETFQGWKNPDSSSVLWLYGSAGCGKTFLCSTLLQDILEVQKTNLKSIAVCYFYFDFKNTEKQSCNNLLRSLAKQLTTQGDCLHLLVDLYSNSCRNGQLQPTEDMVLALVQNVTQRFEHTYIILDALDECTEIESLLILLHEMDSWSKVSIAATSRRKKDIDEQLSSAKFQINIESSLVRDDIHTYTRDRVTANPRLSKWSHDVQENIISSLAAKADGMFQWVFCQLEALAKCIKLSQLNKTLASLPKTLDDTYTRMIHSIESSDYLEDATTILQWLCFSMWPLSELELIDALAVQNGEEGFFDLDNRLPDPSDISIICSDLILLQNFSVIHEDTTRAEIYEPVKKSVRKDSMNVRLAHFSVKEYLLSDRCVLQSSFSSIECHASIAETCLRYLLHVFGLQQADSKLTENYPLAIYAAQNWFLHLRNLETIPTRILGLAFKIFQNPSFLLAWIHLYQKRFSIHHKVYDNSSVRLPDLSHALYYVSTTGLPELIRMVLQNDSSSNHAAHDLDTALIEASSTGSKATVQLLLDAGASPNAKIYEAASALQLAARSGHINVVRLLLEAGADVNEPSGHWLENYPLVAAASKGHEDIVVLLLAKGANFDARTDAIRLAVRYPKILKLILDSGVEIDRSDGTFTPLQYAIEYGGELDVVSMLLDAGADPNSPAGGLGSALRIAVRNGKTKIVQALIERGARYNDSDGSEDLSWFLHLATLHGHDELIPILINHGARVDVQFSPYGSILAFAAIGNNATTGKLLLQVGADVNTRGGRFETPLQAAVAGAELVTVIQWTSDMKTPSERFRIVLESDNIRITLDLSTADSKETITTGYPLVFRRSKRPIDNDILMLVQSCNRTDNFSPERTGWVRAIPHFMEFFYQIAFPTQVGPRTVIQEMTKWLDRQHTGVWTPFSCDLASESFLQTLLDFGATIKNIKSNPTFYYKPKPVSYSLVSLFLDAGADINVVGGRYGTTLQAASRNGDINVVKLLLYHGAQVNSEGGVFGSPIQAACATFEQNVELVHTLITAGANVNACGGLFGTALQAASHRGFEDVVKLLLSAGADVNIQGGRYGNALQAACASNDCQIGIVKLLLDAGADSDMEGGLFGNARDALLGKCYDIALFLPENPDISKDFRPMKQLWKEKQWFLADEDDDKDMDEPTNS